MASSRTESINAVQAEYIAKTQQNLHVAEGFLNPLYPEDARHAVNMASTAIRRLVEMSKRRRGNSRAELIVQVRYYQIWQSTLAVVLERAKGDFPEARWLLMHNSEELTDLCRSYPDRPEFAELLEKIKKWRST